MQREIKKLVRIALNEDQAGADVTSRLLFKGRRAVNADIISKEAGVACGIGAAVAVFKSIDSKCSLDVYLSDGANVVSGQKILSVRGDLAKILAGERTALNIMQHLSGIATLTRQFVSQVKGTRAEIYDTRKTTPGLRILEKYAVRCGGGMNHRMSLKGAAMVKDNHLKALFGSSSAQEAKSAILTLRSRLPKNTQLLIEATSNKEIDLALKAKADVVMLDNMTISQIKNAVKKIRAFLRKPRPQIEVTGGVSLANVQRIARCGVDRISIGRLTHSAPALDISLEIR